MWCKKCSMVSNEKNCIICDGETQEDIPIGIYWCKECETPIIKEDNDVNKNKCPHCGSKIDYLSTDIRPVFPEERLLYEVLTGQPLELIDKCFWANNSRYFIDGKGKSLPTKVLKSANINEVQAKIKEYENTNTYDCFNKAVQRFIEANNDRLNFIKTEAMLFINDVVEKYPESIPTISFSGGKDSTATADLTIKALGNPSVVQIFSDTTLEFPQTLEYIERYKKSNPKFIFKTARNNEQDFYKVCEDIGIPSRKMRWCCTMFKTGVAARALNSLSKDRNLISFIGLRKYESYTRSNYSRIEINNKKIQKQISISPILNWKESDVWLYILSEKIDFNKAYRLGYVRVGCFCCPNNSERSEFLSQLYIADVYNKWHTFIIEWAKKNGRHNPAEYVQKGVWRARNSGDGVSSTDDVKIIYTNCTSEENSRIYKLLKPMSNDFYNLFIPFGIVSKDLGRKLIDETIVLDSTTKMPIISIQPMSNDGYEYSVKIKTLNVENHDSLERMTAYQIRKYNACRKCLKCEGVCVFGAISVSNDGYKIDSDKCKHCKKCTSNKYVEGGCIMKRFLHTSR